MKKLVSVMLAVAMAVLMLTGCGGAAASSTPAPADSSTAGSTATAPEGTEPVTIRVATLAQQLSLPMYYISQQGWDVENGFKLDITTFSQGTGINEALGSGLVDICTIGAAGVSSCCIYDAMYLFSHEDSGAGQQCMVRNDGPIAQETGYLEDYPELLGSPDTIRGATILLPMGTGSQINADTYLNLFGLTEDDVTLVNMDTAPAYQAYVSGEGDMCHTCYPTADEFDASQYSVAFSMNAMDVPYYDNVIASREFYEDAEKHDALVALVVQLIRTAEAFKDDAVLMDTMMEWYELNGQTADKDSIEHQVLERPFFTYEDLTTVDTSASFKQTAEFYASIGNISEEDLEHVFNNMDSTILKESLEAYKAAYL